MKIEAADLKFDRLCLAAPADQPFTIELNTTKSETHDIALYTDLQALTPFFDGEDFTGPAVKVYSIPPQAAGDYVYRCTLHRSQMRGDLVIR